MIYLIDSVLKSGSHSYWMLRIIEHVEPAVKSCLFSIPENPTVDDILEVIDKVHFAVSETDLVVCSWRVTKNELIDEAFKKLAKKCRVIVAAGNTSDLIDNYSPAHLNEVTTVGCLNKSGGVAALSCRSSTKDLVWVPGTNFHIDGHTETGTSVSAVVYAAFLEASNDEYELQQKLTSYKKQVHAELNRFS